MRSWRVSPVIVARICYSFNIYVALVLRNDLPTGTINASNLSGLIDVVGCRDSPGDQRMKWLFTLAFSIDHEKSDAQSHE